MYMRRDAQGDGRYTLFGLANETCPLEAENQVDGRY